MSKQEESYSVCKIWHRALLKTHSHDQIADLHQSQCVLKSSRGNYTTKQGWGSGINLCSDKLLPSDKDWNKLGKNAVSNQRHSNQCGRWDVSGPLTGEGQSLYHGEQWKRSFLLFSVAPVSSPALGVRWTVAGWPLELQTHQQCEQWDVASEGKYGCWPTKWRMLDWKLDFCLEFVQVCSHSFHILTVLHFCSYERGKKLGCASCAQQLKGGWSNSKVQCTSV